MSHNQCLFNVNSGIFANLNKLVSTSPAASEFARERTAIRMDHESGNPNSSRPTTINGPLVSAKAMFSNLPQEDLSLGVALRGLPHLFKK